MLPVFVINLDRRQDRWAMMSEQLDRLGIAATRIPAVDARSLAAEEEWQRDANGNPTSWRINLGSAANMLGHSKAMAELLDSDAPAALILEDDAELAPDTPLLLAETDWWPSEGRIVRLEEGYSHSRPLWGPTGATPSGRAIQRLERWCGGSAAYMIDRRGAQIALAAFADPDHTVDHTLFDLRYSQTARRLCPVQIVPAMARQRAEYGTDQRQWRERAKLRGRASVWRRLRRSVGVIPYKARVLTLFALGVVRKTRIPYSEIPRHEGGLPMLHSRKREPKPSK